MVKIKKIVKFWLAPFIWFGIIFFFSSLPTVETSTFYFWDFVFKKSAHFIEYFILSTLIYRALINYDMDAKKSMFVAVFVSVLYAMTDEYHQSFVPGRGPAVRDVFIDTFGAVTAVFGVIGNIKVMPKVVQGIYKKYNLI